jgi:hypothetical protein
VCDDALIGLRRSLTGIFSRALDDFLPAKSGLRVEENTVGEPQR